MKILLLIGFVAILTSNKIIAALNVPMVINTWSQNGFNESAQAAWNYLKRGMDAIDALEIGCMTCEKLQCDGTVGYGGSPDETGETTLDALIFDGTTMNMGAVGALRRVKNAISVAKHVLQHTSHSLLVGDQATVFAKEMGFKVEDISTQSSKQMWKDWKNNHCQPNMWINVKPDSKKTCGPYKPVEDNDIGHSHVNLWTKRQKTKHFIGKDDHDTIGMIVIDSHGNIVAGTSTNGMNHKIPGRVGDSPIPGAGAYADSTIGAASATGDGDIMMRFLPSYLAVEEMRRGASPQQAAKLAIERIRRHYKHFFGGIIVVDKEGNYGAACNGMQQFTYTVANHQLGQATIINVNC